MPAPPADDALVATVNNAPRNASKDDASGDLAAYQAPSRERAPICAAPIAPASGASAGCWAAVVGRDVAVLTILKQLERFDMAKLGQAIAGRVAPASPKARGLAYADRDAFTSADADLRAGAASPASARIPPISLEPLGP